MTYTVSVTSQGQISIPAKLRRQLGLDTSKKALVSAKDGKLLIEPVKDFLSLGGSLKAAKKAGTREIREEFGKYLAKQAVKGLR